MAFPTWGAAGTIVEGAAGIPASIAPAWPAHVAGDIGILIIASGVIDVDVSAPQGFREIHVSPRSPGVGGETSSACLRVFWKRAASAAESAPTIVVPATTQIRAQIVTVKGCAASGTPFDTMASGEQFIASTSATWPSIVTQTSECLVMGILAHSTDSATPQGSGYTNTSVSNMTERVDDSSQIGDGQGIIVWTATRTNPGTVLSTTATLAASSRQSLVTLAFTAVQQSEDQTPYVYKFGTAVELSTAGTLTPAWPSDHEAGDVAILVVASGGWPLTFADQAGFTQFAASPQTFGSSGAADACSVHVFWKRATSGAEGGPTINFIADHLRAVIFTVKGCAGSGFPVERSEGNAPAAASDSGALPVFSTENPYMQMLGIVVTSREAAGAETIEFSSPNISFYNKKYDIGSDIGSGTSISVGTGSRITPGQCDITYTVATIVGHCGMMIALRPSSGATITCDKGSFSLSGKEAFVLKGVRILCEKGAFALSARDATLATSTRYRIACDRGSFFISGRDASVVKTIANWTKDSAATNIWTKDTAI